MVGDKQGFSVPIGTFGKTSVKKETPRVCVQTKRKKIKLCDTLVDSLLREKKKTMPVGSCIVWTYIWLNNNNNKIIKHSFANRYAENTHMKYYFIRPQLKKKKHYSDVVKITLRAQKCVSVKALEHKK